MSWWKLFKPKSCNVNLKATAKDEALAQVVETLVKSDQLPRELAEHALEALREREELASTGVGGGVAIPHVKLEGIDSAICSLSTLKEGIEWAAVDGAPVEILFTILRPAEAGDSHDPEAHLEMMRWIAKLAREADFRSFALQSTKKSELVDLLKEMSAV